MLSVAASHVSQPPWRARRVSASGAWCTPSYPSLNAAPTETGAQPAMDRRHASLQFNDSLFSITLLCKKVNAFFFFFLNSLLPSGEGFHGYKRWHSQYNNIVLSQTPVLLAKLGTTYISSGNKHRIIQSLQYKSELCFRFVIICYSRLVWIVQIPILMHYFGTYNDAS